MSKGYATVLTSARESYISSVEFKSHSEAAAWAAKLMTHLGLTAASMKGVTWPDSNPKKGSISWP